MAADRGRLRSKAQSDLWNQRRKSGWRIGARMPKRVSDCSASGSTHASRLGKRAPPSIAYIFDSKVIVGFTSVSRYSRFDRADRRRIKVLCIQAIEDDPITRLGDIDQLD